MLVGIPPYYFTPVFAAFLFGLMACNSYRRVAGVLKWLTLVLFSYWPLRFIPVPTMPRVKSKYVALPANGRKAAAACRVVAIWVGPWTFKVAPVVRIIKYMIALDKTAPLSTSVRESRFS